MNLIRQKQIQVAIAAISLGWLALNILFICTGDSVWDDAYMFSRYGDHFLSEGAFSWNPGAGPVYGMTSPAWAFLVSGFRLVFSGSPALALYSASMLTGITFICVFIYLVRKYIPLPGDHQKGFYVFAALTMGFAGRPIAVHFSSGMDTSLAMLAATVYLFIWKRFEGNLSPGKALALGLIGGGLWWIRPELIILALVTPVAMMLFSRSGLTRAQSANVLLFSAFGIGLSLVLLLGYFGNFMPLSFYVKSGNPYGAGFFHFYKWVPFYQLLAFFLVTLPCWIVIALAFYKAHWKWRLLLSPAELGLFAGALLLIVYFTFGILQIMPFHSRFYFILFPIIFWTALKCWKESGSDLIHDYFHRIKLHGSVLAAGLILILTGSVFLEKRPEGMIKRWGIFDLPGVYLLEGKRTWPLLDKISLLPDSFIIASTEVGLPGAWNPSKKMLDLAGLNDPLNAGKKFNADSFFKKNRPDIIYLPHPHYEEMNAELLASRVFKSEYDIYPPEKTNTFLGIAIKKNSKWFYQLNGEIKLLLKNQN